MHHLYVRRFFLSLSFFSFLTFVFRPSRTQDSPTLDNDSIPLTTSSSAAVDLEQQPRRKPLTARRVCGGVSAKRLTYIAVVAILCVAITVAGIVVGIKEEHKKKAKEEEGVFLVDEEFVKAEAMVVLAAMSVELNGADTETNNEAVNAALASG